MSQLENKYGISRSTSLAGGMTFGTSAWDSQFNEFNMDETDQNEYSNLKLLYDSLSRDLGQYETQMEGWVDGPLDENSFYKHHSVQYTNLERITLADGRKAWKTNQGTFFPAPNGMPGGPVVPKELLN